VAWVIGLPDPGLDVVSQVFHRLPFTAAILRALILKPFDQPLPAAMPQLPQGFIGPGASALRITVKRMSRFPDVFAGMEPVEDPCRIREITSMNVPTPVSTISSKDLLARLPIPAAAS